MCDLLNPDWLQEHVKEHGPDLGYWSQHAKNAAAKEALHNPYNADRLPYAMADFFNNHGLRHLYMEDDPLSAYNTRRIVWDCLAPLIFEQIEQMENESCPL